MPLQAATPILRIFDEAKAREFYLDFLGFRLDWQHRFDDHAPLYWRRRTTAMPAPAWKKRPGDRWK